MKQNTLLIVIITIISLLALVSYFASPVFQLHNIIINDLQYIDSSEINGQLSDYLDKNIWLIAKSKIKKDLQDNRYIEKLNVKKNFPDTIKLTIEERIPVAKINNNGNYTIFTVEGYILEEGIMETSYSVPLLKGIGYSFSDKRLKFPEQAEEIIKSLGEIDAEINGNIREIVIKNNTFSLVLNGESQPKVNMGGFEDIERKFKTFASIYTKMINEDLNIQYIDLGVADKPVISK